MYIYQIIINDKSYIGSTTSMNRRYTQHKFNTNNSNAEKYNYELYKFIRNNGGFEKIEFKILTSLDQGLTLEEQKQKEQEYITLYKPSLNIHRAYQPIKTKKEYDKERINRLKTNLCNCCNKLYTKHNLKAHQKTKKYLLYLSNAESIGEVEEGEASI